MFIGHVVINNQTLKNLKKTLVPSRVVNEYPGVIELWGHILWPSEKNL